MYNTILSLFFATICSIANSQNCKYSINKTDEFTKMRIVVCSPEKVLEEKGIANIPSEGGLGVYRFLLIETSKFVCKLGLEYSDSAVYLRFYFSQKNKDFANFIKGIYLLIKDSSSTSFYFENPSAIDVTENDKLKDFIYSFELSNNSISKLKTFRVKKIRLVLDGLKQYDFAIKEKTEDCLIGQFKCLETLTLPYRLK